MRKCMLTLGLLVVTLITTNAQQTTEYPTDQLKPAFHAARRAAFREKMGNNTIGIFFAAQVRNRSNDVDFQYAQNKNFFYFTGFEEPNAVLVIFKEPQTILGKTANEFLFVQPRNPAMELWTGKILGEQRAPGVLGIENVFNHTQFTSATLPIAQFDSVYSLYKNEDILSRMKRNPDPLSKMTDIVDSLITSSGKKLANNTGMLMRTLRHRKTAEEIALIQKAVDISCEAHNEVMKAARPGMTEYQVQAIMEYGFKKHGSEYPGYPSINGSADNACVLHYVTNQRLMKDGDLLLSDCAAEYHGYTADITRTIPINGKFTPEQKIIYELVLEAADSAILECRPGIPFRQPHMVANRVIARGLVKLGIIKNESEVRKYFPHGTSHHLGLDVHDQGLQTLDEGVVLTVEPGIYIPSGSDCDKKWWSIGVRIEDDIVITKDGRRNMSTASPRTVAEVEKMMKVKSRFD